MKKIPLLILSIFFLFPLITAQSIDIEFPNGNEFGAGESITFKTTLYNDVGNPIDGQIEITIKDAEKRITEKTISSKEIVNIDLGEKASSGQGMIRAKYQDIETIAFFEIGRKEIARFELNENVLIITNIGNTPYTKTITITIGETTRTQEPNLEIGESISYRLIAPDGSYNIRVSDGKTTLTREQVKLTGTGQAIGAIDESTSQRAGITGVTSPSEDSEMALLSYVKDNKFVYIFVFVIFGATILLAIERRYRKKLKK